MFVFSKSQVSELYQRASSSTSDIVEHIPVLRALASRSDVRTIAEMGVRAGVSTWAFLQALIEKPAFEETALLGFDIDPSPAAYKYSSVENMPNLKIAFTQASVLQIPAVVSDLLFIDTFHVYGQLKRELFLHAPTTRKLIVLHDTSVDGERGEFIRERRRFPADGDAFARSLGMEPYEISVGLWPAVTEFLGSHPEWRLTARYLNCNGLTILERVA